MTDTHTDAEVMHVERVHQELDAFIEKRAEEAEPVNLTAEEWRGSGPQADHRAEWAEIYRMQIRAAEEMRERAEARLIRLIDGEA